MNVSSQLERAQAENLTSDAAAATKGRFWWNTSTSLLKIDDGSTIRTIVDLNSTQTLTNKTITIGSSANLVAIFNASNNLSFVTAGTNGQALIQTAGVGAWADLGATHGGTGLTSYTTGDIIYCSASNVLSKLAIGSSGQILKVSGGLPSWGAAGATLAVTAKTANYTILSTDDALTGDSDAGAFTFTLPDCATNSGKVYKIKKVGADFTTAKAITVARAGSDTIFDVISGTSTTLNTPGEEIEIASFGSTVWQVLSRRVPSVATSYTLVLSGSVSGTPAAGTGTTVSNWQRVGNSIRIKVSIIQTNNAGAVDGSGTYLFSLPSGITIDTALCPVSTNTIRAVGWANFSNSSAGGNHSSLMGGVFAYDSSHVMLAKADIISSALQDTLVTVNSTSFNFSSAAAIIYNFEAVLPISGWNG